MKKLVSLFVSFIAIASVALPAAKASAVVGSGQAHLTLSTASTYTAGSTALVTVRETSSVAVAGVEADFSYNPAQLQYIATDTSSSAFNTPQPSAGGGGSVTIARTEQSGTDPVGSATIAVVSFKVLASSGTANLTVLSSSDIDDSVSAASLCDSSCAGGNVGASFQMSAPAPAPAQPGQTGGSTTAGSSNKTSGSSPSTETTASGTSNTTGTNGTASTSNNGGKSTTGSVKGASTSNKPGKTTGKVATTSTVKTHHTGLVTSTISIILLIAAGAYWFFFQKRTETAPAKVYKLDTDAKDKSKSKATAAAKVKSSATKSTRVKK